MPSASTAKPMRSISASTRASGSSHLVVELCHALFLQLAAQGLQQGGQDTGIGKLGADKRGDGAILGRQGGNLILAGGRIQQVCRKFSVKADCAANAAAVRALR